MPSATAIHCFIAAGRYSSFTKAAEELFMTRQAVSRQIALLEKELGVQLFQRTTARVELTPVGELYIQFFQDSLVRWEETRRKAQTILSDQGNLIRIGCNHDTDLGEWVFRLAELCRQQGQSIRVNWERGEPHDLLGPLLAGQLDIVLSFEQVIRDHRQRDLLEHRPVARAQAVLVVRDSHPLAIPGASARDFQNEPCFISRPMLSLGQTCRLFQEEWMQYGIRFSDIRLAPNRESLQTMVETGRGVTICTTLDRFPHHPHLLTFPLDHSQTVSCIWRKGENRPPVLSFLQVMLEHPL